MRTGAAVPALGLAALGVVTLAGLLWAHVGAGIAVAPDGRVYVLDTSRDVVWRIDPDGRRGAVARDMHGDVLAVRPDGTLEYPPPGPGGGFAVRARDGSIHLARRNWIARLADDQREVRFAGDSAAGYRDGPAHQARFWRPHGMAVDASGNLYVADYGNRRVRKVTPDGTVSTVALISWPWWPTGVAVWGDRVYVLERWGDYYRMPPVPAFIADLVGHPRVRVITPGGEAQVLAAMVGWPSRIGLAIVLLTLAAGVAWRLRRALSRLRPAA